MKKSLLLLSILLSFKSFSQVPTGIKTPVDVKNQILYLGQNIHLDSNSNLYLQNNSQLIQRKTDTSSIIGIETVSLTDKTNNDGNGDNYDGPPPPPPLIPYFKLNTIINNEFTRQLKLIFASEATDGVDKDIDVKNMDADYPHDISFWIENEDYIIQGLNFNLSKKIPLSLKAAASTKFKFYISETDGFDDTQPIYIYDALDKSYHDIRKTPYQVVIAPGKDTGRFKISFTNNGTLETNHPVKSIFFISHDHKNQVVNATNPNNEIMKSFGLYNILGKSVISKDNLGAEQNFSFSTSALNAGVYIAIFTTADGEKITQKIIISNSGY